MIYLNLLVVSLGLVVGSFLNALIYRIHSGESIAAGRSKCPHCQHSLTIKDLVPVLSFVWLRGHCRYCRQAIAWQYPVVEAVTALLFWLAFSVNLQLYPTNWELVAHCFRDFLVLSALVVVFVYDLKWMLIPDSVVLPVVVVTVIINLLLGQSLLQLLLSLAIGFGFFAIQYYFSGGTWIGGGDLRLGLLMGAVLAWPNLLVAIFLAYIVGATVSVGLLLTKKVNRKTEVPFGVFLAPATVVALLWGSQLLNW